MPSEYGGAVKTHHGEVIHDPVAFLLRRGPGGEAGHENTRSCALTNTGGSRILLLPHFVRGPECCSSGQTGATQVTWPRSSFPQHQRKGNNNNSKRHLM